MKKLVLLVIPFILLVSTITAQSLSINTDGSTANTSSILDVKSTVKGLLIPRMSRTERNAIASPATGLMIFQNSPDSIGLYYYTGSGWTWMLANANSDSLAWRTGGNTGTGAANFIGTTDNTPLNFKVFNQKAGRIDASLDNSFFGYFSGNSITTGDNNTANGSYSLYSNTSGYNNTANGSHALYSNKTGRNATAVGTGAMYYSNNTVFGFNNYNVAVGYEALRGSTSPSINVGNYNSALGYQSLWSNTSGFSNTAVGMAALFFNTSGSYNTGIGDSALFSNNLGDYNTSSGRKSLYSNTSGDENTAYGNRALYKNINGNFNTATGSLSLFNNNSGTRNTANGIVALYNNSSGDNNTANGAESLYGNSTGYYNTANGYYSLYSNSTGSHNTASGSYALYSNSTGSYNTAIGDSANVLINNLTNATAIGAKAAVNCNDCLVLGSVNGTNNATASVNVGIGTTAPSAALDVIGNTEVSGNLTVQTGMGIIRNISGTQLKKLSNAVTVNASFTAGQTQTFTVTWPQTFSAGSIEAYVGNITSGVGGWAEVIMTVTNVSTTGATLFVYNAKSSPVNPNYTVNIIAIGPQ